MTIDHREALALAALMAVAVALAIPGLSAPASFDGTHAYLPMARRFLEEGWAYFSRPESLSYAPVAFLYPAVLGASESLVRHANVALYAATVALVYVALRIAGRRAAIAGAALFALAPAVWPLVPDVLTEPPYLFLTAAWLACVAWASRDGGAASMVLGGCAIGMAALTRPSLSYFPAAMCIIAAILAWRGTGEARRRDMVLAGLHGIGFGIVIAVVLRNALAFGYPSISTGLGGALFLGVNALVDGFDPVYYGMGYDVGAATAGLDHLSLEGDRLLRGAALEELRATPWMSLVAMGAHKAMAFVLVAPQSMPVPEVAAVRGWRMALLPFAAMAIVTLRHSRLGLAAALFAAYGLAIHVPLLYHHRYSVGVLELPLAVLAALGMAALAKRPRRLAWAGVAAGSFVVAGLVPLRSVYPAAPHPERSPHEVVWARSAEALKSLRLEGIAREAAGRFRIAPGGGFLEFPVSDAPLLHPWDISMVTVDLAVRGCMALVIRYRRNEDTAYDPRRAVRVALPDDGRRHAITVGAAVPRAINHEGVLRLQLECGAAPGVVDLDRVVIAAPRRGIVYRTRFLERAAKG